MKTGLSVLIFNPKRYAGRFLNVFIKMYNMIYLHPRDFDIDQPRIQDLNLIRRFKYYVNISKSWEKLDDILNMPIETISFYDSKIDWKLAPTINLSMIND